MRKCRALARNSIHAHIAHIIKVEFSRRGFYWLGKFTAAKFHGGMTPCYYGSFQFECCKATSIEANMFKRTYFPMLIRTIVNKNDTILVSYCYDPILFYGATTMIRPLSRRKTA